MKEIVWQYEKSGEIINIIKTLKRLEEKDLQEGPLDRLREALNKLEHKHLDEHQIYRMIDDGDIDEALKLCNSIQTASRELYSQFDDAKKHPKQLKKALEALKNFKRTKELKIQISLEEDNFLIF